MAVQELPTDAVPVAVVTDSSPRTMTTSYNLDTTPPAGRSPTANGDSRDQQPKMEEDLSGFWATFSGAQVLGVLVVLLVAIWTGSMAGGFAWRSNPSLEFNWHPLLMVVGFVFLYGNSIMIYRGLRAMRKQKLKLIHAGLPVITLLCIIIAQVAVFDSHNLAKPPIPNLYSLHSWIGLGAIILYVLQWVIGLVVFLYPGASVAIRTRIMSWHVFSGLFIFSLVVIACVTGLLEKAIFKLGNNYGALPSEGMMINFIGIFIILFALSVFYITTNPKFKRYPRPEDGALLTKSSVSE
ncbi:cytochrome [Nesidiocoris tenuis]|uniref:Cytochrome n=1 Tax=Nesidiocoris tenuis TaxID=355587 RepID=A0ABN7AJ90_9HEMI|nr:cytochrome [Nesidiocoris tenuis]